MLACLEFSNFLAGALAAHYTFTIQPYKQFLNPGPATAPPLSGTAHVPIHSNVLVIFKT